MFQCVIWEFCINTEGVLKKNEKKAAEWYEKAAELGNSRAQNWLGLLYQHGNGVPKDEEKALKLFAEAAEKGCIAAQNHLGLLYENGIMVLKDEKKAVEYYQMAANSKNDPRSSWIAKVHISIIECQNTANADDKTTFENNISKFQKLLEDIGQMELSILSEGGTLMKTSEWICEICARMVVVYHCDEKILIDNIVSKLGSDAVQIFNDKLLLLKLNS